MAEAMIGVLVDVSGSMETAYALDRSSDASVERTHAILTAIMNIVKREVAHHDRRESIFACAFGLNAHSTQGIVTCDLISLLEYIAGGPGDAHQALIDLAKQHETPQAEPWIRNHLSRLEARILYTALCSDPSLVPKLVELIPSLSSASPSASPLASKMLRKFVPSSRTVVSTMPMSMQKVAVHRSEAYKFAHEIIDDPPMQLPLQDMLQSMQHPKPRPVQDVTVTLDDLLQSKVSSESSSSLHDRIHELLEPIKPYIFGQTPMCRALNDAVSAFRETNATRKVLFILSDGQATDGDPRPIAEELRDLGVTIVTCFLTSDHIDNPRRLYYEVDPSWCPMWRSWCPKCRSCTRCPTCRSWCPTCTGCPICHSPCPTLRSKCPICHSPCSTLRSECPMCNSPCPTLRSRCPICGWCPTCHSWCPTCRWCPTLCSRCPTCHSQYSYPAGYSLIWSCCDGFICSTCDGRAVLFEMSSTLKNTHTPISYLTDANWELPPSGKSRLFVQANSLDVVNEFCKTVVSQMTKSCDALVDILEKVPLATYINQTNAGFEPKQQEKATCYANAIAAVFHLAMHRIVGREGGIPDFYKIRKRIIDEYGVDRAYTDQVLAKVCPEYRLHFHEVDETGARQAINKRQPVVATFSLHLDQWEKFSAFYESTPKGILERCDLTGEFYVYLSR